MISRGYTLKKNKDVMLIFIVPKTTFKKKICGSSLNARDCLAFFAIFERKVRNGYTISFKVVCFICCLDYIFYMELVEFCDAINIEGIKWKSENKCMQLMTKNTKSKFFSSCNLISNPEDLRPFPHWATAF